MDCPSCGGLLLERRHTAKGVRCDGDGCGQGFKRGVIHLSCSVGCDYNLCQECAEAAGWLATPRQKKGRPNATPHTVAVSVNSHAARPSRAYVQGAGIAQLQLAMVASATSAEHNAGVAAKRAAASEFHARVLSLEVKLVHARRFTNDHAYALRDLLYLTLFSNNL